MSYFIFNGIDSRNLGLIVTATPFRPSWETTAEEIIIPGRRRKLLKSGKTYENQDMVISTVISDTSRIREINSAIRGFGDLILSTNLNEKLKTRVYPLIPAAVALDMAELDITFDCFPLAESINPTTYIFTTSYTEIVNNGTEYSEPVIKLKIKAESAPILKGDVNFDGTIDATDASLVMSEYTNIVTGGTPTFTDAQREAADMDGAER